MLPEIVWDMPRFGTINLHGSLLPKYRGAAPLNWAIIRGERITGVTTFQLKHEIDTGDMILQRELSIGEDENFGSLYERMKILGAETLIETMHLILSGDMKLQPQNSTLISNAPKIKKETCEINFNDTVTNVYNFIRGLSPFPCSWFYLDEKEVKVYAAKKILKVPSEKTGDIITDNKKYLQIACLDGYLQIEELKMEGKKKMDIRSFLNGYQIKNLP